MFRYAAFLWTMGSYAIASIQGKYPSPRPSMGRRSMKEMGRKAENARLTLRTDQFQRALVIVVAATRTIEPQATLVKNNQFTT